MEMNVKLNGKFQSVKEAREAVREILGNEMVIVCVRYDDCTQATEVVSVTPRGIYWMVKFYNDGMIGYGTMDFFSNLQFM